MGNPLSNFPTAHIFYTSPHQTLIIMSLLRRLACVGIWLPLSVLGMNDIIKAFNENVKHMQFSHFDDPDGADYGSKGHYALKAYPDKVLFEKRTLWAVNVEDHAVFTMLNGAEVLHFPRQPSCFILD